MNDDWSQFSLGCFSARNSPTQLTTNDTHKRVTQLVSAEEYSRALKTLLSTATPSVIGSEEIHTMRMLHPTRSEPNHPLYTDIISEEFRITIEPYSITPQQQKNVLHQA